MQNVWFGVITNEKIFFYISYWINLFESHYINKLCKQWEEEEEDDRVNVLSSILALDHRFLNVWPILMCNSLSNQLIRYVLCTEFMEYSHLVALLRHISSFFVGVYDWFDNYQKCGYVSYCISLSTSNEFRQRHKLTSSWFASVRVYQTTVHWVHWLLSHYLAVLFWSKLNPQQSGSTLPSRGHYYVIIRHSVSS